SRPVGAEPAPNRDEEPTAYTCRAAQAKARAVLAALPPPLRARSVILAADTVVALAGDILGKPRDTAHALAMLERLAGRAHEVISAVCLCLPPAMGATEEVFSDTSRVF
ncbi:MAG: Maf family protein, partial [Desulfovibrionaceae bacterium]|nr:Maf family protein [Desulfovibrionaceae bacterium]